jgi:GTP-binding protein EngB required for normal cell division
MEEFFKDGEENVWDSCIFIGRSNIGEGYSGY